MEGDTKKKKEVKLLVTGSRSITDARIVDYVLTQVLYVCPETTLLYHGGAKGVDNLAGQWAEKHKLPVHVERPRAYVKDEFLARDRRMVEAVDYVVGIWDGQSNGTRYTMAHAEKFGKLHSCWLAQHVREELGIES